MNTLSPIAIFAFKRADHLSRALQSLAANTEFRKSELFIFCDGPRGPSDENGVGATRQIARQFEHPRKKVIERDENLGLATSITRGVSELTTLYRRVIVVEDDLVVSKYFLDFMNRALDRYQGDDSVMQISGHLPPIGGAMCRDAGFLPMTTTWGWATWERSWRYFDPERSMRSILSGNAAERRRFDLDGTYPYYRMMCKQDSGKVDSWGISWYLSVFARRGLVLYPRKSLVFHELDGTGTHCKVPQASIMDLCEERLTEFPPVEMDFAALNEVKSYYRHQGRPWKKWASFVEYIWQRAKSRSGWKLKEVR
jgi:hypothetical protein